MQISRPNLIGHDVIMSSKVLGSRKICFADPGQGSKVNMVLNVHRSHRRLVTILGTGRRGYGGGGREILYLSLHCHYQNDFCTKVGSDESHFNNLIIVRV